MYFFITFKVKKLSLVYLCSLVCLFVCSLDILLSVVLLLPVCDLDLSSALLPVFYLDA